MNRPLLLFALLLGLGWGCAQPTIRTDDPGRDLDRAAIVAELRKSGLTLETATAQEIVAAAQIVYGPEVPVEAAVPLDDGKPETTEDPIEITFESPGSAIPKAAVKGFVDNLKDLSLAGLVSAGTYAIGAGLSTLFAYFGLRKAKVTGAASTAKSMLHSKTVGVASVVAGASMFNELQGVLPADLFNWGTVALAQIMAGLRVVTDKPIARKPAPPSPPPA